MSAPVSLTTARAVGTFIPSMRVRSTPHSWNSCLRSSNFSAFRVRLRFLRLSSGRSCVCSCRNCASISPSHALHPLGDFIDACVETRILHLGQNPSIAPTGHDCAQDLLARFADDVRDDVGEQDVHLRQRKLHVLDMASLSPQQHRPLP